MFGTLGGPELFLIFVVALIVFGPRKLPDIGKSLGKMMSEFRRASNDFRSTIESEVESEKIRESMRIEPPKVKKVETSGGTPSSGAADSEASSESGDMSEDAVSDTETATSAEGSAPKAEPATEGSATPGDPSPESGSDGEGEPSTISRQPPPPAIEPK
jgi:Tat protein translocase TatB subunit